MKTQVLFLFGFIFTLSIQQGEAQGFQGKVTYMSKTTLDFDFGGRKIPEDQKQRILKRMKDQMEKTFVLNFNKTEAIYKQEEVLSAPTGGNQRRGRFGAMFGGASGKMYKNTATKESVRAIEFFGKSFLVEDPLQNFSWKLVKESKKIGKYNCFKATAMVKEASSPFSKDANKEAKDILISVWYTPEIPVSQGPDKYWGLPGLILGVSSEKMQIVCTKIVMNVKERIEIKAPKKGKKISEEKFQEIVKEKTAEMRERFKKGRGHNGGGNRTIIRGR